MVNGGLFLLLLLEQPWQRINTKLLEDIFLSYLPLLSTFYLWVRIPYNLSLFFAEHT